MSAALHHPTQWRQRRPFTRTDVERLEKLGAFEGHRYELIDGVLVDKMGQNPPHPRSLHRMDKALTRFLDADLIRTQAPIEVALEDQRKNLPEPDLFVMREDKDEFDNRHPRGDELLLIVEVADASASMDLSRKADLYARAGVPEYWVLDIGGRRIVVHRQPEGGKYKVKISLAESASVSLEGRNEAILVADILPPQR